VITFLDLLFAVDDIPESATNVYIIEIVQINKSKNEDLFYLLFVAT